MEKELFSADFLQEQKPQTHAVVQIKHAMILLMVLAIMASIFVPVWQSAVNRALEVEYKTISIEMRNLEEQQRLLRSHIAQQKMPEALVKSAWREDILLTQINADSLVMVGRRH